MRKIVFAILTISVMILSVTVTGLAHSGRTDSRGGHKDNKNKSGLGGYHYHCGGYPAHLHSNGSCPYKGGGTAGSNTSKSSTPQKVYATKITVSNMPKSISPGDRIKLDGSVYPANAEDKEITWESSDISVAKVDSNGNLTAMGVGAVVISAKTSRGTTSKFNLTVNEVVAENIIIEGKVSELKINETATASVAFVPKNTTYKNYEWKSDDTSIASVDENGKITALGVGKTTITATHKDISDSFEIEVIPILAESKKIRCIDTENEYEELRFEVGETIELKSLVLPENTTDSSVKWSVSDDKIATINQYGNVLMVSSGIIKVMAETSNGIADEIELEVYKNFSILDIIAYFIVFLICVGIICIPAALIIILVKKLKK